MILHSMGLSELHSIRLDMPESNRKAIVHTLSDTPWPRDGQVKSRERY